MKELLVKDILPDLEQATDVPKRVQEVRTKPVVKQEAMTTQTAQNIFDSAFINQPMPSTERKYMQLRYEYEYRIRRARSRAEADHWENEYRIRMNMMRY